MLQEEMIARVREMCRADEEIVGAWMYGSFTKGEGDEYSDIEFLVYLEDEAHATFDPVAWLNRIAPVGVYFTNEFGVGAVIFENLIRGEFHFEQASDMPKLREYGRMSGFAPVEALLVSDRTGELREHLAAISGPGPERGGAAEINLLWRRFLNWMLFGSFVLARGERIRVLELLANVQRCLLQLARLSENQKGHWMTPSKSAEAELSAGAQERYRACTAGLRGSELEQAYLAAWAWGVELAKEAATRQALELHPGLIEKMDERFRAVFRG